MLQLRCTFCQTMFAISRDETLAALEHMDEEKLKFYDAHCPKCRRANRVERFKMEFSYPGWRNEIKNMAKAAETAPQPMPSAPAPAEPEEAARKRHAHKPAEQVAPKPVVKKTAAPAPKAKMDAAKPTPKVAKKPVAKPASKKPAAKQVVKKPAIKPVAKKPAAKPAGPTKGKKTGGGTKKK
jgi:hypothetical protein